MTDMTSFRRKIIFCSFCEKQPGLETKRGREKRKDKIKIMTTGRTDRTRG